MHVYHRLLLKKGCASKASRISAKTVTVSQTSACIDGDMNACLAKHYEHSDLFSL